MNNPNRRDPSIQSSVKLILREYAEALTIAIVLAIILRLFVVSTYKIPTGSMTPSLKVGDFIFAYKLPYGLPIPFSDAKLGEGRPKRGDVVVFECPQNRDLSCVKRVVALPGDRVEIIKKRLIINGEVAEYKRGHQELIKDMPGHEFYVVLKESISGHERAILIGEKEDEKRYGPVVVPPQHFFVLGDNRDTSDDSRFWGPISFQLLEARVVRIWMSVDWSGTLTGDSWPRVRWGRLFQTVN